MKSKHGFLLMTALPPTRGHLYLIEWAKQYCLYAGIRQLTVMVCAQPTEPMTAEERVNAIRDSMGPLGNGVLVDFIPFTKTMPQEPEETPDFWLKWVRMINLHARVRADDIVFASERYGHQLAAELGCAFVPCNTYREVVSISASQIREKPFEHFAYIAPAAQKLFRKTITIYGPESTGKTHLAKALAKHIPGHYVPEWAREYLELQTSPEVTEERMQTIVYGQMASQEAVHKFTDKPFIFQDTDLLSTIGYYEIGRMDSLPAQRSFIAADHYLLLKDNVPFVADPLRYGVTQRERTTAYWEGLLKEAKLPYTLIDLSTWGGRYTQSRVAVEAVFNRHPIWSYRRHE